jgi:hypothetical protein
MSLFGGAMLLMVLADNLLLLFIGWEIMGFCSYSLIGFWYAREYPDPKEMPIPRISPRRAAVKAFMTTRVADVLMLLGIVFFYRAFGTLSFSEAFSFEALQTATTVVGFGGLGIMTLLLFAGTVGKSSQWPLHVWLPDAMEGPTPVSAIIHAAAMVSAGVYLIVRIFPLIAVTIEGNPTVGVVIAIIGAFTALMSATIAVAQNDVKGVLAYSTISQLGFMVAAIGIGAYVAGAFHLITHAFFKALLFLASGSVIHGMEHGALHVHDHHTDPQDMRHMGGLRQKMPRTFWTFPDWRHGALRFAVYYGRFLVEGRNFRRRLVPVGPRRQGAGAVGLHHAGRGGPAHGFLHHAPDQPDLPGQAAQPAGRARAREQQLHDAAANRPGGLCGGGRLVWYPGQLPGRGVGQDQPLPPLRGRNDLRGDGGSVCGEAGGA